MIIRMGTLSSQYGINLFRRFHALMCITGNNQFTNQQRT